MAKIKVYKQKTRKRPDHDRLQYIRHKDQRKMREAILADEFPERRRARRSISRLVESGELPLAKTLVCVSCGNIASDYHHPSYLAADFKNVIPLCRSCHVKTHKGVIALPKLGIVVQRAGIIRIAIAK